MFAPLHQDLGRRFMRMAAETFRVNDWTLSRVDPDGLRYMASVWVWVHWFMVATCFVQLVYRPWYGPERYAAYAFLYSVLVGFSAYIHYRLASNRTVTWRWIFALCTLDVALISAGTVLGGGFSHYFFHLLYYTVLAGFAAFFTSFRLNMAFVTVVAVLYLAISLTVGDGVDLAAREEKPLFARIVVMYGVVAAVNVVSKFERTRWRAAVDRERALQQERIELSQSIHDTTAQSAYMIGLGIDAAQALGRSLQPGAHGPVGGDLPAVEDRHLAAEAPDRHGTHLRRPGAGPHPGVPRLNIHASHLGSGGPGAARAGAAPSGGSQEPAVLDSPQRVDQRLSPRGGRSGGGGTGLREG